MKIFRLLLILFVPVMLAPKLSAKNPPRFKVRSGYHFEDVSFTVNTHGFFTNFYYDIAKKWGLRAGVYYLDKFDDEATTFSLGGTYWLTKSTILDADAEWAPDEMIVPRQAYSFEVSQILFKIFVPSLGYRFAGYEDVNVHSVRPGFTLYFYPRWDFAFKYYLTVTELSDDTPVDHSFMARLTWNPKDPLFIFAGYSRTNESFESGNLDVPVGGFSSDHYFIGARWEFYKGLGADFSFDYENRDDDTDLKIFELGVFYRW